MLNGGHHFEFCSSQLKRGIIFSIKNGQVFNLTKTGNPAVLLANKLGHVRMIIHLIRQIN